MKSHFVSLPELPSEEQERLFELKNRLKYKILDIHVKLGAKVKCDDILATYGVFANQVRVWSDKIKSCKNGIIRRISINKKSRVRPGTSLMTIEYCPHEMEFNGLCALCGADITNLKTVNGSNEDAKKQQHIISGQHIGNRRILSLTQSALHKLRKENALNLSQRNKLALVLDIDHTFLHATREAQAKLVYKHHAFKHSTHRFILPGHRAPYYIKIRPGFREFLLDVAAAFDIHLYTMAMRKYAEEIVRWIECDDKYKGLIQNLVTRDDIPSNKKMLHRLFPCDERMVLIIDDRIDVWPNANKNVIQIHKYLFWPNDVDDIKNRDKQRELGSTQITLCSKLKSSQKHCIQPLERFITNFFAEYGCYNIKIEQDIIYIYTHKSPNDEKLNRFSIAIKDALRAPNTMQYMYILRDCTIKYKINSKELKRKEGDRVLSCLSNVLLKIHKKYYHKHKDDDEDDDNDGRDARTLLKSVKQEVFGGFVFVFSGCFPIDCNVQNTYEWKISIQFGAKCVMTLSADNKEKVTHCIAPRMGTKKTSIALKLGLELVHPNWVLNSTTHYMVSNPCIYRPSGYNKEDDVDDDKEKKLKPKSILIGNKRKHNHNDSNNMEPKKKKVKFEDEISNESEKNQNLMQSLSQFVDDFNKNKDLVFNGTSNDDIVIENEDDNSNDDDRLDNFDFDDIHQDIDNAIKQINGDSTKNEDEDDHEDDDMVTDDIEDILNDELTLLSS